MRKYLDTSLLVAVLTGESKTQRLQAWLGRQDPQNLLISEWVLTEFSAALSVKLRMGQIGVDERADALSAFAQLTEESFEIAPITSIHFRTAARFADQYKLGLRAGDALHLAIAWTQGAALCTLDRRLAEAGRKLGVSIELL